MNDRRELLFKLSVITHQFEKIRTYYGQISPMISYEKKRIIDCNTELQKKLKEGSDETKDIDYDFYADDWYLSELIEKTFCNSVIITIYTIIEKNLNEVCIILKEVKNIQENYDKLEGQGVIRAKEYIEIFGGISFCTQDSNFLSGINAIRNVIAHNNGDLKNSSKLNLGKIKNISQKAPGCKIVKRDPYDGVVLKKTPKRIELELEFVEYCLTQSQSVFKNIFKQLA